MTDDRATLMARLRKEAEALEISLANGGPEWQRKTANLLREAEAALTSEAGSAESEEKAP